MCSKRFYASAFGQMLENLVMMVINVSDHITRLRCSNYSAEALCKVSHTRQPSESSYLYMFHNSLVRNVNYVLLCQ